VTKIQASINEIEYLLNSVLHSDCLSREDADEVIADSANRALEQLKILEKEIERS
jgi:hypothetical protein